MALLLFYFFASTIVQIKLMMNVVPYRFNIRVEEKMIFIKTNDTVPGIRWTVRYKYDTSTRRLGLDSRFTSYLFLLQYCTVPYEALRKYYDPKYEYLSEYVTSMSS